MKAWILKKFFSNEMDLNRDAKIREAFVLAHKDIMETMQDDIDKQAEELAKQKLNDLLVSVDLNSIVRLTKNGILSIGPEKATEEQLLVLKAEAEYLAQSNLWRIIYHTPNELANKAMFADDGTLDNLLLKGRAILFTLATQLNIVEIFRGYEKKPQ